MSGTSISDHRFAPRTRGLATSLLVALIAVLAMATPVLAKVPYFTIEAEGGPPTPGESLDIVVRMYEDAGHTRPADWLGDSVADLVAVRPADGSTGESLDVLLVRTAPGVYRGSVVIPRAGTWIVRPFPDANVWGDMRLVEGYPDDMTIQVAQPGPALPVIGTIVLFLAGVAGLVMIAARHSTPRLDPQTGAAG